MSSTTGGRSGQGDPASTPAGAPRARFLDVEDEVYSDEEGTVTDATDGGMPVGGIAARMREVLERLGEDPEREGLAKTPARVEAALRWLTRGYDQTPAEVVGDALFTAEHQSMIMVRDIELYSLCEHHMLPFFGRAHVAYIPDGRIVGLSKLARVVDVFARRLQVQERLTDQIADAVMDILRPAGVGVVIEAAHFCMMMRGVEKQNSRTVTSALRGAFRDDQKTREEFLSLAHGRRSSYGD
jgi:GTP cyclohydrolase I